MKRLEYIVTEPKGLLETLIEIMPATSRTEVKELLAHHVYVDGRRVSQFDYPLQQGMKVTVEKLGTKDKFRPRDLDIVFEDRYLFVVNKHEGLLSSSKNPKDKTVITVLNNYLEVTHQRCHAHVVHRLDRDTSGLMVVAKSTWAYHQLQKQFEERQVKKRYVALLDGDISGSVPEKGTIRLPLRPDIDNRPHQIVDVQHGKEAVTDYQIMGTENGHTRIALFPRTGRTHQLRVHCAHPDGLGTPILGDALYGRPCDRLYLHAEQLTFTHPATGKVMTFYAPPSDFSEDGG